MDFLDNTYETKDVEKMTTEEQQITEAHQLSTNEESLKEISTATTTEPVTTAEANEESSQEETTVAPMLKPWERPDYKAYASVSKPNSVSGSGVGCLTIVNSKKNGKRLEFPKSLIDALGNPDTIQVSCVGKQLCVGVKLPGNGTSYTMKKQRSKRVVYATQLIEEISRDLGISFENRVCVTFYNYEVDPEGYEGQPIAVIEYTTELNFNCLDRVDNPSDYERTVVNGL